MLAVVFKPRGDLLYVARRQLRDSEFDFLDAHACILPLRMNSRFSARNNMIYPADDVALCLCAHAASS